MPPVLEYEHIVKRYGGPFSGRKVTALEDFYRQTHTDVVAFQRHNGFHRPPGASLRTGRVVATGFDYNHGVNVIWNASERMFVMIDW